MKRAFDRKIEGRFLRGQILEGRSAPLFIASWSTGSNCRIYHIEPNHLDPLKLSDKSWFLSALVKGIPLPTSSKASFTLINLPGDSLYPLLYFKVIFVAFLCAGLKC